MSKFSTLCTSSFFKIVSISPKLKSRMRLQAAVSLLHLSTVAAYANAISGDFIWLAITVQVSPLLISLSVLTSVLGPLFPSSLGFLD